LMRLSHEHCDEHEEAALRHAAERSKDQAVMALWLRFKERQALTALDSMW
jgi:hypothetical protein